MIAIREVEKVIFGILWHLQGGNVKGIFREIRHGVQSVRSTGQAFVLLNGIVVEITGIRGHLHPHDRIDGAIIHIESMRVAPGQWVREGALLRTDVRISQNGHGSYAVAWSNNNKERASLFSSEASDKQK